MNESGIPGQGGTQSAGGAAGGGGAGDTSGPDALGSNVGGGVGSGFPATATFDTCTTGNGDGFVTLTFTPGPATTPAAATIVATPSFTG